jgi:hypothetical protein
MSSRRFAVVTVGVAVALGGCHSNDNPNRPEPINYVLRFVPESIILEVGQTTQVSLFASRTSTTGLTATSDASRANDPSDGLNINIRNIEWWVDKPPTASLSGSRLSTAPAYAIVDVTCQTAGSTSVVGAVTLDNEVRLTQGMPLTCTAPASTAR